LRVPAALHKGSSRSSSASVWPNVQWLSSRSWRLSLRDMDSSVSTTKRTLTSMSIRRPAWVARCSRMEFGSASSCVGCARWYELHLPLAIRRLVWVARFRSGAVSNCINRTGRRELHLPISVAVTRRTRYSGAQNIAVGRMRLNPGTRTRT
jgi:hypothetical protein